MSDKVVDMLIRRVQAHCLKHELSHFEFIFHGGEPLLLDKNFYRKFVARSRRILLPDIYPIFSLQTNGTLLTEEWCQLFQELNISFGISLDGPAEINNKSRVDHQGNGSYDAIVKGLRIAQNSKYSRLSGVLCVINVSSDPLRVYEHFKSFSVKNVCFLFPYATHDHPPPGLKSEKSDTPYADWLISIFNRWFEDEAPKPKIRLFEQIIGLILGIDKGFELLGNRNLEFLVIETDGSIEVVGALKVCGNGFTKAGMNVLQNNLDEALDTDLAKLYHLSHQRLPSKCKKCPIVQVCGGGFLPHRYSREKGFDNPSIFCLDLMKLITHIQNKLWEILPDNADLKAEIEPISFEELKSYRQIEQLANA